MTFLEAIARYVCAHSGGTQYTDANEAVHVTAALEYGRSCFLHETPNDKRVPLVVLKWGEEDDSLPADDPRELQTVAIVVYSADWHENDARFREVKAILGTGKLVVPDDSSPRFHARVESCPKPQPEGREEQTNRCVSIVNVQFQYVTL